MARSVKETGRAVLFGVVEVEVESRGQKFAAPPESFLDYSRRRGSVERGEWSRGCTIHKHRRQAVASRRGILRHSAGTRAAGRVKERIRKLDRDRSASHFESCAGSRNRAGFRVHFPSGWKPRWIAPFGYRWRRPHNGQREPSVGLRRSTVFRKKYVSHNNSLCAWKSELRSVWPR